MLKDILDSVRPFVHNKRVGTSGFVFRCLTCFTVNILVASVFIISLKQYFGWVILHLNRAFTDFSLNLENQSNVSTTEEITPRLWRQSAGSKVCFLTQESSTTLRVAQFQLESEHRDTKITEMLSTFTTISINGLLQSWLLRLFFSFCHGFFGAFGRTAQWKRFWDTQVENH